MVDILVLTEATVSMTIREIAVRLRRAADPAAALARVRGDIEAAVVKSVRDGMAAGRSPDGLPFAPLKRPRRSGRTGPPLTDTGALAAGVTATVEGSSIIISATGPGVRRHQAERPFLGLNRRDREIAELLTNSFLMPLAGKV